VTDADPKPHPGRPYFEEIGDVLGDAYLRYSFTKGSDQEVRFLLELLNLPQGARLLDVGCGPGRHAVPLAAAGLAVTGVDVSQRFLDIAAAKSREANVPASFFVVDARQMPFEDEFDAVISICQGAFGLMGKDDSLVLRRMMESARRGGRVVLTAFSALHEARYPRPEATFDVDAGIVHEPTVIKDEEGGDHDVDLWTGVYTPRELRLLAVGVGLIPEHVWSVAPGDFAERMPGFEYPELMMVARKP
jgi:SAM-dependent methyltransferase